MAYDAEALGKLVREMRTVPRPVEDLIPYARNARTHSDEQVALLAGSMREFGFTSPVLTDGENGILAGHARVLAARRLGLEEVPTIDLAHLTPVQKRAYVLADNKLPERTGTPDNEMLALELQDLLSEDVNLGTLGFTDAEVEALVDGWAPDMGKIDDTPAELSDLTATVKVTCPQEAVEKVMAVVRKALAAAGIPDARVAD